MCQIVFLIAGIYFAFRIPVVLKMQPAVGNDPHLFADWKKRELWSYYVFLGATWGSTVLSILIGLVMAMFIVSGGGKLDDLILPVTVVNMVMFLGGLIWAAVLSAQASSLKKRLNTYRLPPSYYPRPNQPLMQAPAEDAANRPASDLKQPEFD